MENDKFNDGFNSIDTTIVSDIEESNESTVAAGLLATAGLASVAAVTVATITAGTALTAKVVGSMVSKIKSYMVKDDMKKLKGTEEVLSSFEYLATTLDKVKAEEIYLPMSIDQNMLKGLSVDGKVKIPTVSLLKDLHANLQSVVKVHQRVAKHYVGALAADRKIIDKYNQGLTGEELVSLVKTSYGQAKGTMVSAADVARLKGFCNISGFSVKGGAISVAYDEIKTTDEMDFISEASDVKKIFGLVYDILKLGESLTPIIYGDFSDGDHDYITALQEEDRELCENWIGMWDKDSLLTVYPLYEIQSNYSTVIDTLSKLLGDLVKN